MTVTGHAAADPAWCEEYGYGLGEPTGIFLLKYRSAGALAFGEPRQDFLHQVFFSPDGVLSTWHDGRAALVDSTEAFWVERAVTTDVRANGQQTVYRICLREAPPGLAGVRVGPVAVTAEAARSIRAIARPGVDVATALAARSRIMDGLDASTDRYVAHHARGRGYAMAVARELAHDPGDPAGLDEWADDLHISGKTLQRDFHLEFGRSFSRWRTQNRLAAARTLLRTFPVAAVSQRVGYANPSAFIAAYAAEYGRTPGGRSRRANRTGPSPGGVDPLRHPR